MADVLKIDTHLHLYETKEIGAFEKGDYGIWEYGQKSDVKFSAYDGDLEDTLDAMESAGFAKAIVVNLFSTRGCDGAGGCRDDGEDVGVGEGVGD